MIQKIWYLQAVVFLVLASGCPDSTGESSADAAVDSKPTTDQPSSEDTPVTTDTSVVDTARDDGPAPPAGRSHRYFFKLHAVDQETGQKPGATKAKVLGSIKEHILAEAVLIGTYQR